MDLKHILNGLRTLHPGIQGLPELTSSQFPIIFPSFKIQLLESDLSRAASDTAQTQSQPWFICLSRIYGVASNPVQGLPFLDQPQSKVIIPLPFLTVTVNLLLTHSSFKSQLLFFPSYICFSI